MNPWDVLSADFDTHKENNDLHPDVADNVMLAWPSMYRAIEIIQKNDLNALDFGCGIGGFCAQLQSKGYKVTGCDSSASMIEVAKKNHKAITFYRCESHQVSDIKAAPFDLITSIMVFPFIEDIDVCIGNLSRALKPNALMVFATFNPDFIKNNQNDGGIFSGFDNPQDLARGLMRWGNGMSIPIFSHTQDEYDVIFTKYGFKSIFVEYPPFTESYLQKYPADFNTTFAEFMVLAYIKC